MNLVKSFTNWLNRNLSADPGSSNSRVLQTLIVLNLLAICWVVAAVANWVISDNLRIVLVTLIVSGAGAYAGGKVAGVLGSGT